MAKKATPRKSTAKKPRNLIDVLLVPVGQPPVHVRIRRHYKAFQKAIGGRCFTSTSIGPGVQVYIAEDIQGIEDQPNGCGFFGAYFFAGECDENGDTQSLTPDQFRKAQAYWQARKDQLPPSEDEVKGSLHVMDIGGPEHMALQAEQRRAALDAARFWASL